MGLVSVQCLGSGDAFGSGGRYQTCYFVDAGSARFLIDCGASALIAMKRFHLDAEKIDTVLISHLHGDHFGGLPFLVRETQIATKRTRPLTIAGPKGLTESFHLALEALFPGAADLGTSFETKFLELADGHPTAVGPLTVTSYPVLHRAQTSPHALRVEVDGRVISYSGDTEWTETLIDAARRADLFICEAYTFDTDTVGHLSYRDILNHMGDIDCGRLLLTHMGGAMLARLPSVDLECAEDGQTWTL